MTLPRSEAEARELLAKAAATFRRYEELHRAKGTAEAYEKSKANGALAHEIECFLNASALPPPDLSSDHPIADYLFRNIAKEPFSMDMEDRSCRDFYLKMERDVLAIAAALSQQVRSEGAEELSAHTRGYRDALIDMEGSRPAPVDEAAVERAFKEAAQRLQDHMEQHHGICLAASEWDAAINQALTASHPSSDGLTAMFLRQALSDQEPSHAD